MFERYVESARRTIQIAESEAVRLGSSEIGTEHILLGLLRNSALVNEVMTGLAVPELSDEIMTHLAHVTTKSRPRETPLSTESKEVLVRAREEAQTLSHRYLNNYHILVGLLRVEESYAAQVLRRKGLSADYVRGQISVRGRLEQEYAPRLATDTPDKSPAERSLDDFELLATELAQLDDYAGALKLIDKAIADPSLERNQTVRRLVPIASAIATTIGDLQSVQRYYELWLTCDPDETLALYGLACCLKKQGKADEASKVAGKCFKLSVAEGGEIGKGLAEMIVKRWPEFRTD